MNLDEKIRYIKKAKDENKLIIFVGAGISKNSNLPDWNQLIKVFINKLNYPIEDKKLSADEYLKIPQYYYNMYGNEKYKKLIKETLDIKCQPNEIHKLIFKLNPRHIITTNYDRLLEDTIIEQRMLFDVICNDKDLLNSKKNNYIIKMHGDIKDLDNIVLKENDYLNYSQNHVLIETYIKSLLVSNTFLFVGYSLNDYNLKQIISWVEYLAKSYTNINDRPKNFIIQEVDEKYNEFIEDYHEKNNLFILNPNEIENEFLSNISTNLSNEFGKRLYHTLMYINEYPNTILDKLYYGCMRFKELNRVSIYDLSKIYNENDIELIGGNILKIFNVNSNEDIALNDIVNEKNEKGRFIKEILIKTGIEYIYIKTKNQSYPLITNFNEVNDEISQLKDLELKCNYLEIERRIHSIENRNTQAYYFFKLQEFEKSLKCLESLKESIISQDMYKLLLYKLNLGLINQLNYCDDKGNFNDFNYIYNNIAKNSMYELNYLNEIFKSNKKQLLDLETLKKKHINQYLKLDNSVFFGNIKQNLYKIITITYDYYFYIKDNNIFLDYFNNVEVFIDPFLESILSTYSPKTKRVRNETFFPDFNKYEQYILNKYDFDILVKYSKYENLQNYFKKYEVKELKLEKNVNILEIVDNLSQYVKVNCNRYNIEYLKKLILILSKINLNSKDVNKIIEALEDVLINSEGNLNLYIFSQINISLNELLNKYKEFINENSFEIVINELFKEKVFLDLKQKHGTKIIFKFLNHIKYFSYNILKEKIDNIIKKNKLDYILILGLNNQFDEEQKKVVKKIILKNIDIIDINDIIECIFCDIIDYNLDIERKIIYNLELHISDININSVYESYQNKLKLLLDNVVILHLMKKNVNISKFNKYTKYNDILNFVTNPNDFDYKKINFYYNWMNIMKDEKYLKILIDKSKHIIGKKLKYDIDNGFANEDETRLYYKYFEIENI